MGEGSVVVDGFDTRVGGEVVGFGVESFGGIVDVAAWINFVLGRVATQQTYLTRTLSWINHL